jgi:hypothetical protein
MKELVIKELQQSLETELNSVAQDSLKDIDKYGIMMGMVLSADIFKYGEIAVKKYTQIKYDLGLTESEIEAAVNQTVSKVLKRYINI